MPWWLNGVAWGWRAGGPWHRRATTWATPPRGTPFSCSSAATASPSTWLSTGIVTDPAGLDLTPEPAEFLHIDVVAYSPRSLHDGETPARHLGWVMDFQAEVLLLVQGCGGADEFQHPMASLPARRQNLGALTRASVLLDADSVFLPCHTLAARSDLMHTPGFGLSLNNFPEQVQRTAHVLQGVATHAVMHINGSMDNALKGLAAAFIPDMLEADGLAQV